MLAGLTLPAFHACSFLLVLCSAGFSDLWTIAKKFGDGTLIFMRGANMRLRPATAQLGLLTAGAGRAAICGRAATWGRAATRPFGRRHTCYSECDDRHQQHYL